ncbi:MAG: hypothetical protein IPN68_02230 [Bacteroidetes bacterium]|nr:hypothetical protein [Bacteroidota bacterium]
MISAGMIIAVMALYRLNNPYIGIVVIWAFTGIILKRMDDFKSIVIAASAGIVVVAVVTVLVFLRKKTGTA